MDKKYIAGMLAFLIFGLFLTSGCEVKYTQEELDAQVAIAEAEAEQLATEQLAAAEVLAAEQLAEAEVKAAEDLAAAEALKDAKIEELEVEILELTPAPATPEELGYVIDEIEINGTVTKTLSDKQINLFDGEVKFDGKDYDTEEVLKLIDLLQESNGNDFKENTYLSIPANSIEYIYSVENSFDTSKISDDETLEISLLGKEVEISKWEEGKITLTSGTEYLFEEGESKEIEGQTVTVVTISDISGKVLVKVGEESKVMIEGETESFGDLDVYVKEVLANEAGEASPDICTLKIGKDIKTEIEDGEYDEDNDYNIWEWEITNKTIRLFNAEEFLYLDEDDTEFNVKGAGESICLPNDYVCVKYNGLDEESTESYKFDLYTKGTTEYVRVKGNFVNGLNDFERIYIERATPHRIFDKDMNELTGDIELGDTEMKLVNDTGYIKVKNDDFKKEFKVNYDLNKAKSNGNVLTDEDNFLTLYGIVVKDAEDSIDDQEWTIVVPEEQLFGSITVY